MKTIVMVATYNEKHNIRQVLDDILAFQNIDVVVIDDDSPDGTAAVVEAAQLLCPRIHLIVRKGAKGLGGALQEGLSFALECGYDRIINMDGDSSHNAAEIPSLLHAAEHADLVIGDRFLGKQSSKIWSARRQTMTRLWNLYGCLLNLVWPADNSNGFRCWTGRGAEFLLSQPMLSNGFAFHFESAIRLERSGLKVVRVPAVFRDRIAGKSKLNLRIITEAIKVGPLLAAGHSGLRRYVQFCIVGLSGAIVDTAILHQLVSRFHLVPEVGKLIAAEVAIIGNFALNNAWTFRQESKAARSVLRRFLSYNAISLFGVAINGVIMSVLVRCFGIDVLVANGIGIVFVSILSFWASRRWAWGRLPDLIRQGV